MQARFGVPPFAFDEQFVVWPNACRSLEPLDIVKQARDIGETVILERNQSAARSHLDFRDPRIHAIHLDMHQLEQIVGLDRQVAKSVDHFCCKGFDFRQGLETVHSAIQTHSE